MKLNVYGIRVDVLRKGNRWLAFYCGNEGKKRLAQDINIPDSLPVAELVEYVADLCHEWASPENNEVTRVDP